MKIPMNIKSNNYLTFNWSRSRIIQKLASSFAIIISLFCIEVLAQEGYGTINVQTIDDVGEPIEFAAVVLYRAQDSTITKVVMTDTSGRALFEEIPYNQYYLHTSFVGLEEYYSQPFSFSTPSQEIDPITMTSSLVLDEVVLRSQVKLVERKIDRTVLNVGATLMAEGGSLSDVLKIAPGVTVGNSGALSLRGKAGVIILIDGRASYLQGPDLENYINSMPANQFSRIEIMTNPPAKYDAEGNAGVINIVTKRNSQKGWNVDLATSYRQGKYAIFNHSLGWNLNSAKVSVFGNISYTDQNDFDNYNITRNFNDDTGTLESIFEQFNFIKRETDYWNGRLGMDYFATENTTVGFLVSLQNTDGKAITDNTTFLRDGNRELLSTLIAPAESNSDYKNVQANVHLTHAFDTIGRTVSIDVDYLRFDSKVDQLFENRVFDPSGTQQSLEILNNQLPQIIDIYTGKIDYTHPFSANNQLEAGFKTSFVTTDNDAKYFENVGGMQIENLDLSNRFTYDENVNAGYLNYLQKLGVWSIQAGVRVEHTSVEGNQLTNNTVFKNDYTNLLPSLFLTYELDEESELGFSYGRRIERPDYRDLNPFRYFYDRFTFEEGNPNLNPQFSDNLELSYSIFKGAISATGYYNKTEDIITDVIFQNADQNETFIRKDNLNDLTIYGLGVNANVPLSENWIASFNLDYSVNDLSGMVDGNNFTIDVNTFSGFMLHQYKFAKTWTFELAAWYTSESLTDTFIQRPYGRLAMAIGKTLWDGQGKIRLSGNDIFEWTKFEGRSAFPNTDVAVENTWQTQTIKLAFTYKIGSGYVKKRQDRKSSIEDESERLNPYDKK